MSDYTKYQSDVIVDLLQHYAFEYIAINPGASFRGLHDSLINYGGNTPKMLVCQHEETAVQIAHGYARATGRPMACILHDLVGLLHGQMAITTPLPTGPRCSSLGRQARWTRANAGPGPIGITPPKARATRSAILPNTTISPTPSKG